MYNNSLSELIIFSRNYYPCFFKYSATALLYHAIRISFPPIMYDHWECVGVTCSICIVFAICYRLLLNKPYKIQEYKAQVLIHHYIYRYMTLRIIFYFTYVYTIYILYIYNYHYNMRHYALLLLLFSNCCFNFERYQK